MTPHDPPGQRKPAARIVAWIAAALLLGGFASVLPWLSGEPPAERDAQRGLAAGTVAAALAIWVLAVRGWQLGRRERSAPDDELDSRRLLRRAVLSLALAGGLASLVVAPSVLAGASRLELEAFTALLQSTLGWQDPWNFATVATLVAVTVFSTACVLASVASRRLGDRRWIAAGAATGIALAAVGILTIRGVPAPRGQERTTNCLALGLFGTVGVTALVVLSRTRGRRDARSLSLAAGFALTGLSSAATAVEYLTPSANDLTKVQFEREVDSWILLGGSLADRPDLHGLFALAPGSRRLELVRVVPGPPAGDLGVVPQRVPAGTVFLDLRRQPVEGEVSVPRRRFQRSEGEIRLRSRWFPFLVSGTGLRVTSAGGGFAVSPSLRFAVSWDFDRAWLQGLNAMQRGDACCLTDQPTPRFQLELTRRDPRHPPEVILRGLPQTAQVLWIDDLAIRFLLVSESRSPTEDALHEPPSARNLRSLGYIAGPRFASLATYLVEEKRWTDLRPLDVSVPPEILISEDRSNALTRCAGSSAAGETWCRFDLRDPKTGIVEMPLRAPRAFGTALALTGGDTAAVWHSGGQVLHWSLTVFDASGHERFERSLAGSSAVRFAGELEDGSIALARRGSPDDARRASPFLWRIEAVDPSTGSSRVLGDELAAIRFHFGAGSRAFFDRDGRLLIPTAQGMVDARRGPRSFVPSLSSTAISTRRIIGSDK